MQQLPHTETGFFHRTVTVGQCLAWVGVLVALLALGAHFFRAGNTTLVAATAGVLLFHCSASDWKRYAVGLFLVWGALEWGMAVQALIAFRRMHGAPWLRGALILTLVAFATATAATYAITRARTGGKAADSPVPLQAFAFILVFLLLLFLRQNARPETLLLDRLGQEWGGVQIFLMSWYAAFVAGRLADPRKSRKTRRMAWLAFTCVFFAQLAAGLADFPARPVSDVHAPIPGFILFGPLYRGFPGMMPFLVLFAALLTGSAWCSMLCYFGPLDSLAGRGPLKTPPPFLAFLLRYGRWAALALGSGTAFILGRADVPASIAVGAGCAFALASVLSMAVLSRQYGGMAHCTAVCPMGLAVNLLGRLSPWRMRVARGACDHCGACEKICAYRAIDRESRSRGGTRSRCSLCRDCLGVCTRNALHVTFPLLPVRIAGRVFVVIVTVVHTLFLAAARPL